MRRGEPEFTVSPNQFAGLRGALQEFVEQVFSPSPYEAQPLLRGVYFVSGTQEGTPIDRMLGSIARQYQLERAMLPASAGQWPQLLSAEAADRSRIRGAGDWPAPIADGSGAARPIVLAGYGVIGVLAVGSVIAWAISYSNNKEYVQTVAARVDAVRRLVQETPNRATAELTPIVGALEATRGLALAGAVKSDADVPWRLGFGLYQGRRLDSAAPRSLRADAGRRHAAALGDPGRGATSRRRSTGVAVRGAQGLSDDV
jgi:type VI secretion system protein ImpL